MEVLTLLLDETEKFFHCHWQNTRATMPQQYKPMENF